MKTVENGINFNTYYYILQNALFLTILMISTFQLNYILKAQYSLIMLEVPLDSINQLKDFNHS